MQTEYITSAARAEQLPPSSLPEIALVGRSNVGKSTFLNSLLNHTNLARASRTPGRTQMVNFFKVNGQCFIVDLPGYGYSKTSNLENKAWDNLMTSYLERPVISKVLFLWDPRRELEPQDLHLAKALSERHSLLFILTKIDKMSRAEFTTRSKFLENVLRSSGARIEATYGVSSLKKTGLDPLRKLLIPLKS